MRLLRVGANGTGGLHRRGAQTRCRSLARGGTDVVYGGRRGHLTQSRGALHLGAGGAGALEVVAICELGGAHRLGEGSLLQVACIRHEAAQGECGLPQRVMRLLRRRGYAHDCSAAAGMAEAAGTAEAAGSVEDV